MEVKDTIEEKIAKQLIAFPKSFKCVQILPNGYILEVEGKSYKIECKEIARKNGTKEQNRPNSSKNVKRTSK